MITPCGCAGGSPAAGVSGDQPPRYLPHTTILHLLYSSVCFTLPPPAAVQVAALQQELAVISSHPLLAVAEAAEAIAERTAADVVG